MSFTAHCCPSTTPVICEIACRAPSEAACRDRRDASGPTLDLLTARGDICGGRANSFSDICAPLERPPFACQQRARYRNTSSLASCQ